MTIYFWTTLLATALLAIAVYWLDKFAALNERLIYEAAEAQAQVERMLDLVAEMTEHVDDARLAELTHRLESRHLTVVR